MKIRSKLLIRINSWIAIFWMKILFWTVRTRVIEHHPKTNPYRESDERYLYCFWHDVLLFPIFCGKCPNMCGMTSQHSDGDYIANSFRMAGVVPIRGSSSKGGIGALREAITATKTHHISITPDGPRGPRHVMKEGIVFLSSLSRCPIIPVHIAVSRFWSIKGKWTNMIVPKPFSTVTVTLHKPMTIPRKLGRDGLFEQTQLVQDKMDEIHSEERHVLVPESDSDENGEVANAA